MAPPSFSPADTSIVIPARNEAPGIADCLAAAARLQPGEIVVVDGASTDDTAAIAQRWYAQHPDGPRTVVMQSTVGRAAQMNAGAQLAGGRLLLFVHADTRLAPGALDLVCAALARGGLWGHFDVRINGRSALLPLVARLMNLRARLSGIATGDQCLFVRRDVFQFMGGYAPLPLMEDVDLSTRLKRLGRGAALASCAETSGRRWEQQGVVRTIARMWALRAAWALGADPAWLAHRYKDVRDPC